MTQAVAPRSEDILSCARRVLEVEARALDAMSARLGEQFAQAVRLILESRGRVIVSGLGKSGHVARKIAATMASTGTPAYFVHAAEALHGDLGMIHRDDVLIALSNSGETAELLAVVPLVKRQGGRTIAMTGKPASTLASLADVHLDAGVEVEACPLNLAPTASTTCALALGDALAVALLEARGFREEDFARSHPGGALGRRLLTHVRDVMRTRDAVPTVPLAASVTDALLQITRGGMGMTVVLDAAGGVAGMFTDGDLRRAIDRLGDVRAVAVADLMTRNPRTIQAGRLAAEAADLMETRRISQLLVTGDNGELVGALTMHDLMQAKVI
ncbi:KpsF/GutQ family sugar-phosphate isomerase [Methyloversatilis thermotolerans]|uniref:KpsF/GutQ family sugar-phosphate isomerase n=1 Tax=Methyloversatilis thermotolerans TaxID=1346290 RepID=UPI0003A2AC65|nr:KpsF/GutQ family sugar-phosphate isomerase [Methyloversatilis thermotolerans]